MVRLGLSQIGESARARKVAALGLPVSLLSDLPKTIRRQIEEDVAFLSAHFSGEASPSADDPVQAAVLSLQEGDYGRTGANKLEDCAAKIGKVARGHAQRLLWLSLWLHPVRSRARHLCIEFYQLGELTSARSLLKFAPRPPGGKDFGEVLLGAEYLKRLPSIPSAALIGRSGDGCRVGYVAAMSKPFRSSGYAVRTHHLLRALRSADVDIECFVRPGFSGATTIGQRLFPRRPHVVQHEEIKYRFRGVRSIAHAPLTFIERVADVLEAQFRSCRINIVHAASNHRNALPALIAARRLALPFVYELRGFWELTTASREPGWELTERFACDRALEVHVAKNADHVLAISGQVADVLVSEGVEGEKISLLPNAVDPHQFSPFPKDPELLEKLDIGSHDFTLVYCGSLDHYEGLDDILQAIRRLNEWGIKTKFIVVGKGDFKNSLVDMTRALELGDAVRFVDTVPSSEVGRYWSLADAVALPRKPYDVCKIVSPLKPYEAMAAGKAVVLSDLPVLAEMVEDGRTGLLSKAGDPEDLAEKLALLARDESLRRRIGLAAREWILVNRTWAANAEKLKALYERLAAEVNTP